MATFQQGFDPKGANLFSSNQPTLALANGTNIPVSGVAFNDAALQAIFVALKALAYTSGNVTVKLLWYAAATSGNVVWGAQLAALTPGDAQSLLTDSLATSSTTTTAPSGTSNGLQTTTVTITNLDSLAVDDLVQLRVFRDGASGSDTMTGDAVLVDIEVSYAATGGTGAGDVTGPAGATDNAIVRFDSTTGKVVQNSAVTVADTTGDIQQPAGGLLNGVDITQFDSMVAPPGSQRVFQSPLPLATAFAVTSGTGYFVYVGKTTKAITVNRVELNVTVAGVGTETREVGLFSTPAAPNRANQSLTKIVATGTVDTVIGGTFARVIRNTSAFAQSVPAGTHLWAGVRFAMATTQPTLIGLGADWSDGQVLTAAASGALTGAGPFSGVVPASAGVAVATALAPAMRVTLD